MWIKSEADFERMLDETIAAGRCPYNPEPLKHLPIGMRHCPWCGSMVVAGMPHGPVDPCMVKEAGRRLEGGERE